jgi:uncharacterized phage protein gp47/JayE
MAQITTNVPKPTFGPTGFQIPSDDAILAGVQADINAAFGGNLNMAPSTPQGQLATSMAAVISYTYQTFLLYTTQTDPAYATGRMQDAIGDIYFIQRDPAEPTVVQCACVGLATTVIPAGSQAIDTSGNIYQTLVDFTIGVGGTVTASFSNTVPGPTPCPANTLTAIYKAVVGWDTVNNPEDGVVGNDTETRAEFEARRQASVAGNSRGTIQAIMGAVLPVPGVLDAYCYQNDTGSPVTTGGVEIPAHSIYIAVVGGNPQAIGQAIWSKKSPGCGYYDGNTSVTVTDQSPGYNPPYPSYTITFEIPDDETLGFLVVIQNNPLVPSDGATQVRNAILNAFAGGDGGPRAKIGATTFASRFYAPVAALGPWAQILSVQLSSGWTAAAVFTASIAGTTMTVTAVSSGALAPGQAIQGVNVLGAVILSQLTGSTGSTGTYQMSNTQTAGSGDASSYAIDEFSATLDIDEAPATSAANIIVAFNT